jgi:flagellar basal body rod protein FlgF
VAGIFSSGIVQVQATVGTAPAVVWDPGSSSATTYGALGSVPTSSVLKDVTIINTGTVNIYAGMGTVAYASTTGMLIPVGGQLTIQGYNLTGRTGIGTIWANAGTVGYSSSTIAGLASVIAVS